MSIEDSRTDCPYCLSPIGKDEPVTVCDACGAAHHGECWIENGGCCVRTCKKVNRRLEVEIDNGAQEKLVLSRESVESARPHRASRQLNPCIRCGRQVPEGELYCVECVPEREESQDSRNIGPLLLMLGIVALVVALLALFVVMPGQDNSQKTPGHEVGFKVNK